MRSATRCNGDRGQATAEFALALPIVVMLVLGVIHVAVVIRDQLAIEVAARDGARAAAVSATPGASASVAANAATSLDPIEVSTTSSGATVSVTVQYLSGGHVPVLGPVFGYRQLSATVEMVREPP